MLPDAAACGLAAAISFWRWLTDVRANLGLAALKGVDWTTSERPDFLARMLPYGRA